MNILDKIAEKTRERINQEREFLSLEKLSALAENSRKAHDFTSSFLNDDINIISEIKFASPSEGEIAKSEPLKVANEYLNNGAKALSILTEPFYFKGNTEYISEVRKKFPQANILMKDFVIDEYQLLKAKVIGADAVLLIVALLGEKLTTAYLNIAKELGLTALVEVHDEEEMKIALSCNAQLIGINNRNLKDMTISLKTSEKLSSLVSDDTVLISESGLKTRSDLINLQNFGYKGFLIGTSFMKTGNPGQALANILERDYEN